MDLQSTLQQLEYVSKALELDTCRYAELFSHTEKWAQGFVHHTNNGKAYITSATKGSAIREKPIGDKGYSLHEIFDLIESAIDKTGLNPASGGHLAYVPGGGVPVSAFADFVAALSNRYAGVFYANPGAVRVENRVVRWMADMIGFDEQAGGTLTSGGSIANLTGIICARDALLPHSDDYAKAIVYTTTQVHHCVDKALRAAGLGNCVVKHIAVDDKCRMDAIALKSTIESDAADNGHKPFLIIASAGTTNTGAIDPLDDIASIAQECNCWFHVDAAYGGFFLLTEYGSEAMKGIKRADSVVLDPHKGLFLPYGIGALIVKDVSALQQSQSYSADYLQDVVDDPMELSPADVSLELTRHFRGLRMWLPLMFHGVEPFRAGLEEKLLLTRYFNERLSEYKHLFEFGPGRDLSIVTYRLNPNGFDLTQQELNSLNELLQQRVVEDGRVFLSGTSIDNTYWMRIAILSFRTHKATIDSCIEVLLELSNTLIQEHIKYT